MCDAFRIHEPHKDPSLGQDCETKSLETSMSATMSISFLPPEAAGMVASTGKTRYRVGPMQRVEEMKPPRYTLSVLTKQYLVLRWK